MSVEASEVVVSCKVDVEHQGSVEMSASPAADGAWCAAFRAQLTSALREQLHAFARRRAHEVSRAGVTADDYYERELVADAIADTFLGELRWDPAVVDLATHLVRAIQFRTRDDRDHAIAFPHVGLDDNERGDATPTERESSTLTAAEPSADATRFAAEVLARLHTLARGDRSVLRLLDAYAAGATRKADVMSHCRMTSATYHNARIRLSRLVAMLDQPRKRREAA